MTLIILGAAAVALAAFLPFLKPGTFESVNDNTLIQHGGWSFILYAAVITVLGYQISRGADSRWMRLLLIVMCAITTLTIFNVANNKGMRTLYPLGNGGTPDYTQPGTVADLGIAVYVAFLGLGAVWLGALNLCVLASRRVPAAYPIADPEPGEQTVIAERDEPTKKCPDCGETVLVGADVCADCGYRFRGRHMARDDNPDE